jgi:endonuclease YncB( thermonuclease family)
MHVPPHGVSLPVRWLRTIDGDTVEVLLPSGRRAHVRLLDCWAPENSLAAGRAATHALEGLLEETADQVLTLYWPLPRDTARSGTLDVVELLRGGTSFGRLLGHLFAGSIHVGEWLVDHGHAWPTKAEQQAAKERRMKGEP